MLEVAKSCPRLLRLNLAAVERMTGRSLISIGERCTQLQSLELSGCEQSITNQVLASMARHINTNLQKLDVMFCRRLTDKAIVDVNDENADSISLHCTNLREVNFSSCPQITDIGITVLANRCPKLSIVHLNGCFRLTNASLKALAEHCPRLTQLSIKGGSQFTNDTLIKLAKMCPQLTHLNLQGCKLITDIAIRKIAAHCTGLQELCLDGKDRNAEQQITDAAVIELSQHCLRLRHLELSNCRLITDLSISCIAENCGPHLQVLILNGCERITNDSIARVAKCCPNLTVLELEECSKLTSLSISAVGRNCAALQEINLKHCKKITDEAVACVINYAPLSLRRVNLGYNRELITDESVLKLAKNCVYLESLDLQLCKRITDESLVAIAGHCLNLKELNLSWCAITDRALVAIVEACHKTLAKLNINACKKITFQSMNRLATLCTNLESLKVSLCINGMDDNVLTTISANNFTKLKELNLRGTSVGDVGLLALISSSPPSSFPPSSSSASSSIKLRKVDLSLCSKVTDQSLIGLSESVHRHLLVLKLRRNDLITDAGIEAIARRCSSLQKLRLSECTRITDRAIRAVTRSCSSLTSLELKECDIGADVYEEDETEEEAEQAQKKKKTNVFEEVASALPLLKELDLSANERIDDSSVASLKRCAQLQHLDLGFCSGISDAAVCQLVESLKELRHLDLSWCDITDVALRTIAAHLSSLERLNLCSCRKVTDAGVWEVIRKLPGLRSLNISLCIRTTQHLVGKAKDHAPRLRVYR
ncbi:Lysine-specific demethylase 2A [Balamuthia mandrillaris]